MRGQPVSRLQTGQGPRLPVPVDPMRRQPGRGVLLVLGQLDVTDVEAAVVGDPDLVLIVGGDLDPVADHAGGRVVVAGVVDLDVEGCGHPRGVPGLVEVQFVGFTAWLDGCAGRPASLPLAAPRVR